MKTLIITSLIALGISAADASTTTAEKIYEKTESERVKSESSYILIRDSKDGSFSTQPGTKAIEDAELINRAVSKAIKEAREDALEEAMSECKEDFKNCTETQTRVVSTSIGDIDTDMKKFNQDNAIEVNKEIKVKAKVEVSVTGRN